MHIGRPVFPIERIVAGAVAQSGDVVAQCVDPHVNHVLRVKVHGNAPGERGAGNAQVLQAGLNEVVDHFVEPGLGLDKIRMVLIILHQLVGIGGELKEIRFLLRPLDLPAAVGTLAVL